MMKFSCVRTTGRTLVGTRLRCGRKQADRITAAGITKEVTFEPVSGDINNRIDDAYRTKYKGSPYLDPLVGARARGATVRIVPR